MTLEPTQPTPVEPVVDEPVEPRPNPLATAAAYRALHTALRDARLAANMTQRQAAEALGVPQSFVAKSERGPVSGGRRVEAVELPMFAACYGTTVDALLQGVGGDERRTVAERAQSVTRLSRQALWAKGALLRPRPRWGRSRCAWAPVGWVPAPEPTDVSLVERRRALSDYIRGDFGGPLVTLIRETPGLLEMFNEFGERPLFEAARHEQFTMAGLLFDAGADPDLPQNWSHPYAWAQTARQAVDRATRTTKRTQFLKVIGGRRAPEGRLPWGGYHRALRMVELLIDLRDGPHQQLDFAFVTWNREYMLRTRVRA